MRTQLVLNLTLLGCVGLLATSCLDLGARAYVGYFQPQVRGDVALDTASGGAALGSIQTDFEDDLGIRDPESTLLLKGEVQLPALGKLSISGFRYDESGTGTLRRDFGDIAQGAAVASDLKFDNLKVAWTYELVDVGVFRLAPGLAVDIFDIETSVRSVTPIVAFEEVDTLAPVPMLYAQAQLVLPIVALDVDAGWMKIDLGDADGEYWDLDAMLRVSIAPAVELMAGYRYIHVEGDGTADGQRFDAELDLDGWYIGGGVNF